MPMNKDFEKIYQRFISQYGEEKGKELYYAWLNKKGFDDSKPYPKKKKEKKECIVTGVELKEIGSEFHVEGLIATSHLDRYNDIIPKETLESLATQLNLNPDSGICGIYHSEAKTGEVCGKVDISKPAKVIKLNDGEYGLYVDTSYIITDESAKESINKWKSGELNAFSITYDTDGFNTTDFEFVNDEMIRIIKPDTKLHGYTATNINRAANDNAVPVKFAFKELKEILTVEKTPKIKQINNMADEAKTEVKMENQTKDSAPAATAAPAATDKILSPELKEEIRATLKEELKEILKGMQPSKSPMLNAGDKNTELKEKSKKDLDIKIKEFKEFVVGNKGNSLSQWKHVCELKHAMEMRGYKFGADSFDSNYAESYNSSNFEIKECDTAYEVKDLIGDKAKLPKTCFSKLEVKGVPTHLTTDDDYSGAQTTYVAALANYEQSPARYNDIYSNYIVNQLNDDTTTWNLLGKDNMSGQSAIQIRVRKSRNTGSTTPGYGSEPTWSTYSGLLKLNQHFVTSYIPVAAELEAIELSNSPGGIDSYKTELDNGIQDFMNYINGLIFGTGDGTSESAALGFEHICKTYAGGATSIYGRDRNTFTTLDSGGYTNLSSAPFTLDDARKMVETVRINGARRQDLVFIMSLRQMRLYYQLIQDMQRTAPTSARIGFIGQPDLDGVPIFEEKRLDDDSKTDDIYLIDTKHTRIGIKKAPTYIEMAMISLHRRGIIWMMWNLYCDAPNHNYWIYGAATS